jgi:hypothetical protein
MGLSCGFEQATAATAAPKNFGVRSSGVSESLGKGACKNCRIACCVADRDR